MSAVNIKVLVCNAGTIRVFRVADELNRHGLLGLCVTSLYFGPNFFNWLPSVLQRPLEKVVANRCYAALSGKVMTYELPELIHLLARQFSIGNIANWIIWRNRKFGQWVAKRCLRDIDLVWSFDTSSLEVFESAKKQGIPCILDVSIAHPKLGKSILADHATRRPKYAIDLDDNISEEHMDRRLREMELADCLVAGSSFVAESLRSEGVPPSKIRVNPYGVDLEKFIGKGRLFSDDSPVFLFVGWFSQRKGVYYLLEAWEKAGIWVSGAKLRLVGGAEEELSLWQKQLPEGVEVLGRQPHDQLPEIYAKADIFIFPSLFEGFAKVILEAIASGLPVITTPNACDATAVIDGENGLIVEPGDISELSAAMVRIAADPYMRKAMSKNANVMSTSYSWATYGDRCRDICLEVAAG